MLRFFLWALTDGVADQRATDEGYAPLSERLTAIVEARLRTIVCDDPNEALLDIEFVDQHDNAGFIVILVVNILRLLVCVAVVVRLLIFTQPLNSRLMTGKRENEINITFLRVLVSHLLGAVLNFISVFFWFLVPTDDAVCILRQWFTFFGYTVQLSSLFTKTWLFHQIYTKFQVTSFPFSFTYLTPF